MAASIDLLSGIVAGLRENVSEAPWMAEKTHDIWLVVWNHGLLFSPSVGNFMIPTDELIFFRGVAQPPTIYIYIFIMYIIYIYIVILSRMLCVYIYIYLHA